MYDRGLASRADHKRPRPGGSRSGVDEQFSSRGQDRASTLTDPPTHPPTYPPAQNKSEKTATNPADFHFHPVSREKHGKGKGRCFTVILILEAMAVVVLVVHHSVDHCTCCTQKPLSQAQRTPALTHALLTHALMHSRTQGLTDSLSHSLTRSLSHCYSACTHSVTYTYTLTRSSLFALALSSLTRFCLAKAVAHKLHEHV